MDVESAILRYLPGHQYLHQAFGLQSVVRVMQAFQRHTSCHMHDNLYCIAAFLVSLSTAIVHPILFANEHSTPLLAAIINVKQRGRAGLRHWAG